MERNNTESRGGGGGLLRSSPPPTVLLFTTVYNPPPRRRRGIIRPTVKQYFPCKFCAGRCVNFISVVTCIAVLSGFSVCMRRGFTLLWSGLAAHRHFTARFTTRGSWRARPRCRAGTSGLPPRPRARTKTRAKARAKSRAKARMRCPEPRAPLAQGERDAGSGTGCRRPRHPLQR